MKRIQLITGLLTLCVSLYFAQPSQAHGGVRVGIGLNFGFPGYYYRPYYGQPY